MYRHVLDQPELDREDGPIGNVDRTKEQFSLSKVIWDCLGFALLRSVIGPEYSRHFVNQSDAKLNPIMTWSPAFSRALSILFVVTLISYWLLKVFFFHLTGRYCFS